ncbi:ribosome biogenesis GTPase YlqF [Mycoplasmoides gallisepticum]|uniref:ribosome biogenesis GTPase YlqF n=1 Tax=Mycoplasmoides gallisepticum TaxID=2096 RepID=UPI0012490D04|nr:ribosome biogenesis GTPase YlqF [Mycoplasmoides gallisepticum]QEX47545.1 ribosome biogenesis GTPase YlqF [Mycoplasmoides gallisepticum]ULH62160.1 ribosome biogenesis GTPase YlqF [Mycoplasmoides gallisepticum]ULH67499.1 ribosome biogenesis GTPase YlqF [Mycoplasmoides gallisepticum]WGG23826.1 ribosome biogenesis GTPase YlqF [Mycoplasmoides gallisepticum]WGG25375.1 ribosome biogenesis GTPase YlqF [Mycoplasmoides gallisepticum]
MNHSKINWFPGHMKKTLDDINKIKKHIDLVIQVLDARAINLTSNPDLLGIFKQKKIINVALKSDLADLSYQYDSETIVTNIKDHQFSNFLLNKLHQILSDKIKRLQAKGLVTPHFNIMVIGLPNIGKSSLINKLIKKNHNKVENKAGVTKRQTFVKLNKNFTLYDTPGVLYKRIDDFILGAKLSLLNVINLEVIPMQEVLSFAYSYLNQYYHNQLLEWAKQEIIPEQFHEFIEQYAHKKGFLNKNNAIDLNATYMNFYQDISLAKIAKVNYEKN